MNCPQILGPSILSYPTRLGSLLHFAEQNLHDILAFFGLISVILPLWIERKYELRTSLVLSGDGIGRVMLSCMAKVILASQQN